MEKLVYFGNVSNGKNDEHIINVFMNAIYEVVCKVDTNCEIEIISDSYKDSHKVYKKYYRFHTNLILGKKYKLSIKCNSKKNCKYYIEFKYSHLNQIYVNKKQWYIKNMNSGIDVNILPAWDLYNEIDIKLGIVDSSKEIKKLDKKSNESVSTQDIFTWNNHGEYIKSIIEGGFTTNGFYGLVNTNNIIHYYPIFHSSSSNIVKKPSEYFIVAINKAIDNKIKVLNCSFGGWEYLENEYNAIKNASDILFVVSAGNNSTNIDIIPRYPACYDLDNVIVVGAIDMFGEIYKTCNFGKIVDIFAPGMDIYGVVTDRKIIIKASGTSSAAPFVTALASFLININPKLTPKELKNIIINNCTYISSSVLNSTIKLINFEKSLNFILRT